MGTVQKGKLTPAPDICSWWKHLRPYGRRLHWKRERKAAKERSETEARFESANGKGQQTERKDYD